MSKIKSPQEKKTLSLKRDTRNTFGENSKASRKNIPRSRQRGHQRERHAVSSILGRVREKVDENDAIQADASARVAIIMSERVAFRKQGDEPLGIVIKRKLERREELSRGQPVAKWVRGVGLNFSLEGVFDIPYVAALHKRDVLSELRHHIEDKRRWRRGHHKRTVWAIEQAAKWRKAILRNAPLLNGFFADEPQWRDRMLRWCEETLNIS